MNGFHRYIVPLALLSAACTRGEAGGRAEVASRDSAGVRIVESPAPDRPMAITLVWRADLVPPDRALTAVPWGVAADAQSGRIYAADWTSPRVAIFARDGAFVGEYGRAGDGPGEFRNPVALSLDDAGVLTVWDSARGMLSRWSSAGSFVGEEPVPVSYWGPGFSSGQNGIVAVTSEQSGLSMVQRLVAASSEGTRSIYELPVEFAMMRLPGIEMPAPRIFMPSVVWTSRADTVYVLDGPEYEIDRYENGRPTSSFRRSLDPIHTTAELAVGELERRGGQFRGFMARTGLTAEQIVRAVGFEDVVSPVQSIVSDRLGRLWVTRTRDGVTPGPVDIVEGTGRYQGTLEAAGIPVAFPSDSTVVLLRREELGKPVLSLYLLEERRE